VSGCIVGAVGRVNTDFELSEHIAERILAERLKSLFSWMSSPQDGCVFFAGKHFSRLPWQQPPKFAELPTSVAAFFSAAELICLQI
jgi:hypothetical protein